MQENARKCKKMQNARTCKRMQENARKHKEIQEMQENARKAFKNSKSNKKNHFLMVSHNFI